MMRALSERAILIDFGSVISEHTQHQIQQALTLLQAQKLHGIEEITCGYTTICVHYEPLHIKKAVARYSGQTISEKMMAFLTNTLQPIQPQRMTKGRQIEIPVCYGGDYGPDLGEVAAHNALTPEQVIALHTSGDYVVYMLGFAPGFPFLGGLDPRLETPRRQTPRLQIAAGSVGIAGAQTGIYPLATPGGWQIIGRTTAQLFCPEQNPPTLLRAGDRVRFVAVEVLPC